MAAVLQAFMRKFFEKKMGEFLRVEEGNYQCSASTVRLTQAEIREEAFDELHLPVTLRGGFIDEISMSFSGMFSTTGAEVVIKNVFLVFGPHSTDWSWQHVYECKSRLIDLVMKIYELKPRKKKKPDGKAKGSYFADLQARVISDMKRTFLSMLKVHISNVHFRYEDAITQSIPLACGFKIGYIGASSKDDRGDRRTTGDWRHWREHHARPEFCQALACRRISAYWDLGEERLFALGPQSGSVVRRNFVKLNLRETFSACVVEKVLELFPPSHRRRKYLEGPVFRERLDFHQYVVFPASLRAEVTGNSICEATRAQKAPMKDLDVVVDPLEVALDSEQVRSMNELLAFTAEFKRKDSLLRTRPRESIRKYLAETGRCASDFAARVSEAGNSTIFRSRGLLNGTASQGTASASRGLGSSSPSRPPARRRLDAAEEAARQALVRAWWHHAFQGVLFLCRIPRSPLQKQSILERTHLREAYISLCMEAAEALERERLDPNAAKTSEGLQDKIRDMQMKLAPQDILDWRLMARERRREDLDRPEEEANQEIEAAGSQAPEPSKMPSTLQARVHFASFEAFFLGVADSFWTKVSGQGQQLEGDRPPSVSRTSRSAAVSSGSRMTVPHMTRQLVVKGQVLDVRIEVVQRGRGGHRVARWLELGVGSVSATNCNAQGPDHSARRILSIMPIEQHVGTPVCAFIGACSLQCLDRTLEPGDVTLAAVLQPWEGLANHLREFPEQDTPEQLKRLGFLKDYKDDLGKLMTFLFARVGQVRALDYTPFRRRVLHFLTRGRASHSTDLVRRPSPLALNRELLVSLQRKVEKLTGRSDMLGIVEGVVDGVRGRLVDHYNSQHVLCKEVSLAPMTWKALRNGKPQAFHLQFHQLQKPGERQQQTLQLQPLMAAAQGDSWGLLPWKVAMLLLPKADFVMGLDQSNEPTSVYRTASESPMNATLSQVDHTGEVLQGSEFLKWGRNGKPKKRFVYLDEKLEAIVWKNAERDKQLIGAIPLSTIQDVCTGLQTPVLQRVRSPKLFPDRVLSIVATERTLDLQAETVVHQQHWVAGLKAKYKQHVQRQNLAGQAGAQLPKALERRNKVYPDRFRSDRCTLKSTYKKLQAVSVLGKNIRQGPVRPGAVT